MYFMLYYLFVAFPCERDEPNGFIEFDFKMPVTKKNMYTYAIIVSEHIPEGLPNYAQEKLETHRETAP